jgi:hypothetical protein
LKQYRLVLSVRVTADDELLITAITHDHTDWICCNELPSRSTPESGARPTALDVSLDASTTSAYGLRNKSVTFSKYFEESKTFGASARHR